MKTFLKSIALTFVVACLAVLSLQPRPIEAKNYAFAVNNNSPLVPSPVPILKAEREGNELVFTVKNEGAATLKYFTIDCQGPDGKRRMYPTGRRVHDHTVINNPKYLEKIPDVTVKPNETLTVKFPTDHNPINARLHIAVFDNERGWLQGFPIKKYAKKTSAGIYWDVDKGEENKWWAKLYPNRGKKLSGPVRKPEPPDIGFGQNFVAKYSASKPQGACYNYVQMAQSACEDLGYCPGGEGVCYTRLGDELNFFFEGNQYQPQINTLACYWTLTPSCQCGWKDAWSYWTACL